MKGSTRRVPIFRLSVIVGSVLIYLAVVSVGPYLLWWSFGLVPILAAILSWLEARERVRRFGADRANTLREGARVFVWVVAVVLAGFFGPALLGGWILSLIP
jgi:hypothetical protein